MINIDEVCQLMQKIMNQNNYIVVYSDIISTNHDTILYIIIYNMIIYLYEN